MLLTVDSDTLIPELVIKRLVALATPSSTASLPILALCSSSRLLYSPRFHFLGVERRLSVVLVTIVSTASFAAWNAAASRGSVQSPGSGRPGTVGAVVLSLPVVNHCLNDIFEKNDQTKKKITL